MDELHTGSTSCALHAGLMGHDVAYTEMAWSTFAVFFDMHYPPLLSDFNTGSISPAAVQNQVAGKSHPAYMATVH